MRRIGNGTITVRIRFYLNNWHRIRFVYKSAGSKQLCTIKIAVYLCVSDIQNTNLRQLCSLYCKASILKVFKDHSTGYILVRGNSWIFSVQIYCPKVLIYFGWIIYLIAQFTALSDEILSDFTVLPQENVNISNYVVIMISNSLVK